MSPFVLKSNAEKPVPSGRDPALNEDNLVLAETHCRYHKIHSAHPPTAATAQSAEVPQAYFSLSTHYLQTFPENTGY